jgi:hypothetical protein
MANELCAVAGGTCGYEGDSGILACGYTAWFVADPLSFAARQSPLTMARAILRWGFSARSIKISAGLFCD